MRGVGSLQRMLGGGGPSGAAPQPGAWAAGIDDELRRLKEEEERAGKRQRGEGERPLPPPPTAAAMARATTTTTTDYRPPAKPPPPTTLTTTGDGLIRLVSAVVGRAERAAIGEAMRQAEARGASLALAREPQNPADRNAAAVVLGGNGDEQQHQQQQQQQQHMGYLPRTVAGYLAPLLDSGLLRAERVATTTTEAAAPSAVEVLLRRRRQWGRSGGGGDSSSTSLASLSASAAALEREVDAAIEGCLAAGRRSLLPKKKGAAPPAGQEEEQQHGGNDDDNSDDVAAEDIINSSSGDNSINHGGGHVAAFRRMLGDVRRHDGHLLSDEEGRVLAAVERLDAAPCRLLLRLLGRRARWVPLSALQYADVGDVPAAARALAEVAVAVPTAAAAAEEEEHGGGGDDDEQQHQQEQQQSTGGEQGGLLRFWTADRLHEPETWAAVLSSLTCSTLQAAGLSVMPRGHPALRSTKDALVASLSAVALSAVVVAGDGGGGGGAGGGAGGSSSSSSALARATAAVTAPTTTTTTATTTTTTTTAPHHRLHRAIVAAVGELVLVDARVQSAFRRLQRIYFLNEGQDMGIFLAAERGAVRYPSYDLRRGSSGSSSSGGGSGGAPFPTRRALLEYERALAEAAALEACLARDDLRGAAIALRPALEAVQQRGVHKAVVWEAAAGSGADAVPNPLPPPPPPPPPGDPEERPPPPPPLFLARFSAAWVYTSMATVAVSIYEKEKKHQQAVELLQCLLGGNACPARRGEWWTRLSTNLEAHLKDSDAALEMAEAALADAWVRHGDRLGLQRRIARLCKPPRRWKRPAWAHAVMADPPERRIVAAPVGGGGVAGGGGGAAAGGAAGEGGGGGGSGGGGLKTRYRSLLPLAPPPPCGDGGDNDPTTTTTVTVEELALQHYSTAAGGGWERGVHCEGGVWGAFFALFMWEALFADVPDVFRSPFQAAPLDLDTDAFFPARQALIERRLQEIAAGDADALERTVRCRWAAHGGAACRGISWARWDVDTLVEIARCVGALRLSVVLRLMAEDHAGCGGGGMPDLLLWSSSGGEGEAEAGARQQAGGDGRAKMVEVKSQNDRLSDQQRMWLSALAAGGWDVEVLKVVNE